MFTARPSKQETDTVPIKIKSKIKRHRLNGSRSDKYRPRTLTHSEIYRVGKY